MDKIKVLLVEDEETLAMIIKDTLEGQNFIINTATDGEEGLRLFFDLRPDVLVADVMMPRMDGFEMVRRIRQTDKYTPVLFLTARSAINDVVEGFELGANDYLEKALRHARADCPHQSAGGKGFQLHRKHPQRNHRFRNRRLSIQLRHTTLVVCRNRCSATCRYGSGTLTGSRKY